MMYEENAYHPGNTNYYAYDPWSQYEETQSRRLQSVDDFVEYEDSVAFGDLGLLKTDYYLSRLNNDLPGFDGFVNRWTLPRTVLQ